MKKMIRISETEKKNIMRATALFSATVLFATTAFTGQVRAEKEIEVQALKTEQDQETLTQALGGSVPVSSDPDVDKEETVYVFTNADGAVDHMLVSEWLKNPTGEATISDVSDLQDIENVKGDEGFTQTGDQLTWQADGKDIYYQGTTNRRCPVDVKITYYLNGNEISPKELAGKSGHVKMRFDYTNNETREVEVNGKKETIKVPFVVMTGAVLSNEHFSNIKVTNGKLLSEGNNAIAAGFVIPGLKESLDLEGLELDPGQLADALTDEDKSDDQKSDDGKDLAKKAEEDIPDYIEVEADASDFELSMTMSVVMSDLLDQFTVDTTDGLDTDKIEDSVSKLTDGVDQLEDGSKKLDDGVGTLKDKMGQFNTGLKSLDNGIGEYTDGVSQVNSGVQQLKNGTGTLASKMPELKKGVGQLASGSNDAKKGVDALNKGIVSYTDGVSQVASGAQKLADAYKGDGTAQNPGVAGAAKQIADGLKKLDSAIPSEVKPTAEQTAAVQDQITKQLQDATNKKKISDAANAAVGEVIPAAKLDEATVVAGATQAAQQAASASMDATTQAAIAQAALSDAQIQAYLTMLDGFLSTVSGNDAAKAALSQGARNAIGGAAASAATQAAVNAAGNAAAAAARQEREDITKAVTAAVTAATPQVAGVAGNTASAAAISSVNAQMKEMKQGVQQLSAGASALSTGIGDPKSPAENTLYGGTLALANGAKTLEDNTPALKKGAGKLAKGLGALNNGMKTLKKSGDQLANGATQLDEGVSKLWKGTSLLDQNSAKLKSGSSQLLDAGVKFSDGITTLKDGTNAIYDGILQLDEKGVGKLEGVLDGDLKTLIGRVDAVKDAGRSYHNFSGIADGKSGNVKFIIKTEGVEKE
ncbi:MAG: hypothetical protein K6E84_03820 [Lachnospiraceae bacterium]|nr:hypothetical protein [Lachnospiraceae bacterium]